MRLDVLRKLVALGIVLTPMAVLLPGCDQGGGDQADTNTGTGGVEEPAGTTGAPPAEDTLGGTTGGTIGGTTGTEGTGTGEPEQEY